MHRLLFTLTLTVLTLQAVAAGAGDDAPNSGSACPKTTPEQNKAIAIEFYTRLINETNFDNLERYVGDTYINHNPLTVDGREAYLKYMKPMLEAGGSKGTLRIIQSIAADDQVWLRSKATVGGKPHVLVGIWRFECGRAVEHWDAVQEMVPSAINDHAYF